MVLQLIWFHDFSMFAIARHAGHRILRMSLLFSARSSISEFYPIAVKKLCRIIESGFNFVMYLPKSEVKTSIISYFEQLRIVFDREHLWNGLKC